VGFGTCRLPVTLLVLGVTAAGCGSRRIVLPTGPGAPRADFEALFSEATRNCQAVRTMTAELALRGRVAGERIRSARVSAGLTVPEAAYLLAPAPFGEPVFVLAAQSDRGTLLLSRDRLVVADAPVRAMLDALVGLDLGPADLRALLTGCVVPDPQPREGREYPGWVRVDLSQGAAAWLRQVDSRWRVGVGEARGLRVEYGGYGAGVAATPRQIRVRAMSSSAAEVDLEVALSQVELNVPLDPATFIVVVPPGTESITLEELRERAPLAR